MLTRLLLSIVLVLASHALSHAQTHLSVGKQASVSVNDSTGLLTFYRTDGALQTPITFLAYLSLKLDDSVYSNNPIAEYVGAHSLGIPEVIRVGDSVITVWNVKGLRISQVVFIAPFWSSEVAVIRFRAENRSLISRRVEPQFLLGIGADGDIGSISTANRYDWGWQSFSVNSLRYRPMFIASGSWFRDTNKANVSIGVWSDSILDLEPPDSVVIGDVHDLSQLAFGVPAIHKSFFTDGAVLNEWHPQVIAAGETARLGSFAYGPGRPKVFVDSSIFTFTFYQDHYRWNDSAFAVARPDVEMFVYDRQAGPPPGIGIWSLDVTMKPGDRVNIGSSTNWGAGSPTQRLYPAQNSSFGVTYWNLAIDTPFMLGQTATGFTIEASWPDHAPVAHYYPITIDAHNPHSLSSVAVRATGSYDGSSCNERLYTALAIDSANADGVLRVYLKDSSNMRLNVDPNRHNDTLIYSIAVKDSMKDGDATAVIADYVDTIHARYHYCTIPDTHSPVFGMLADHRTWLDLIITDSVAWDRGLAAAGFRFYDTVNCALGNKVGGYNGDRYTRLTVLKRDLTKAASFCMTVPDLWGNPSFDTCFTWPATSDVVDQAKQRSRITFDGVTQTIAISSPNSIERIEVLDLLGRRVLDLHDVANPASVKLSDLTSGVYIVRAVGSSEVLSTRIELTH